MTQQELKLQQGVINVLTAYHTAFPNIDPPAAAWLQHWLTRYSDTAVLDAIQTLQKHIPQVKARFTTDSVGKAISSLLRADAMKRVIAGAQAKVGGVK